MFSRNRKSKLDKEGDPPNADAQAARVREAIERITNPGYHLKLLPGQLTTSGFWRIAVIQQFTWFALPFLFLSVYGCISFVSKAFGIPIRGAIPMNVFRAYEVVGTTFIVPMSIFLSLFGGTPWFWVKDALFVYLRMQGAVWRALTASVPANAPRFWRPADWRRMRAAARASVLWPYHFVQFWRLKLKPGEVYYSTNPEIYDLLNKIGDPSISNTTALTMLIPHFVVSILTLVALTALYFVCNAYVWGG